MPIKLKSIKPNHFNKQTTTILKRKCSICGMKFLVKNKKYFKCENCELNKGN
jgi:hypothetical protein